MIVVNSQRIFLVAFSLAVFLVFSTVTGYTPIYKTAYACSCIIPESPSDSLLKSDAVFSGKVVKIEEEHPSYPLFSSIDPVWVTFDVDRVWKGPNDVSITIQTPQSSASCGYGFEENKAYLVYANRNGDVLDVSLCSRTNLVSEAAEDFDGLGSPKYHIKDMQGFFHSEVLPPLKQLQSGISFDNILCANDRVLVYKNSNNFPACVKPETREKLIERGWMEIPKQKNGSEPAKKSTLLEAEISAIPKDITTMKPNSVEFFYYPEKPDTKKPDAYKLFMLIRLPEWMGGDANDASAFRAYSAKSLDDGCIVKYWPDNGRQRIENPCQGGMYRVVDGAMTTGLIHRSTPMTALPHLELSIAENGLLYAEPPKWTKKENGVIGYGKEISFDDFRNGSEFLAESFAKTNPEYPSIPLQFAGYDLSEIAPEKYQANVSYLDFPDNSDSIFMSVGTQSVGTGYPYWTKSQSESFQIGDTILKVNKYMFEGDDTSTDNLRTYEFWFKDDGFYYSIKGKNLEFIKKEIVKNFFPEYKYDEMFLISKNMK